MSYIRAIAMRLNLVFDVNFASLCVPMFSFVCALLLCKSANGELLKSGDTFQVAEIIPTDQEAPPCRLLTRSHKHGYLPL